MQTDFTPLFNWSYEPFQSAYSVFVPLHKLFMNITQQSKKPKKTMLPKRLLLDKIKTRKNLYAQYKIPNSLTVNCKWGKMVESRRNENSPILVMWITSSQLLFRTRTPSRKRRHLISLASRCFGINQICILGFLLSYQSYCSIVV